MPPVTYTDDDILSLKIDSAFVRNNPAMFFGNTSECGVLHAVSELISNGIDLFLNETATRVDLSIEDDAIHYSDDGSGLPFDESGPGDVSLAEHYLTHYHNTPTADAHAPHIHLMGTGVGMACVNFVSEHFSIKTWRSKQLWEQSYNKGIPIDSPRVVKRGKGRGTQIAFHLDGSVFAPVVPCRHALRRQLFEAAHLFPGIVLGLGKEVFHAPGGLADLASLLCPAIPPYVVRPSARFSFHAIHNDVEINVGFAGEGNHETEYRSWANGSSTSSHGTHVTGLRDALRAANWKPALAMIHVILHDPQFASPTRNQLDNDFVRKAVRESVRPALLLWKKD